MGRRLLLLTEDVEQLRDELSELQIGDRFTFGDYHGEIEWRVLDKTSDSLLVISEYGLDTKPFDKEGKTNEWNKCSLKRWLNHTFFNKAFDSEEKSLIKNTSYGKVFCLNVEEVRKYFSSKSDSQCKPTQYALSKGAFTDRGYCKWWLRSLYWGSDDAANVITVDGLIDFDNYIYVDSCAVRPAMKLKI